MNFIYFCFSLVIIIWAHPNPSDLSGTCTDVSFHHISKIGETRVSNFTLSERNSIRVYHSDVSPNEKAAYAKLAPAYTMSNNELSIGNVKGTPRAWAWANDKRVIGGLTAAHPRNNRSMCLEVTALSSVRPVPIYEGMKQPPEDSTTAYYDYNYQYMYYAQHGFVHDVGNVALEANAATDQIKIKTNSRGRNTRALRPTDESGGACVLQSLSACEGSAAYVSVKWGPRCMLDLRRLGLHAEDFFVPLLERPGARAGILRRLFVDPHTKAVARARKTGAPAPSLAEFVDSGSVPKLCLLNMSLLYRELLPPGMVVTTSDPSAGSDAALTVTLTPLPPRSGPGGPVLVDSVVVMTALWDHNYHHFAIDSLVKIVRYLPLLTRHPEVRIHIRRFEQFCKKTKYIRGGIEIRRRFWDLLGLVPRSSAGVVSDEAIARRIVSGPIVARHVYVPKSAECSWAISSAHNVRLLTNYLLWTSLLTHRNSSLGSESALRGSLTQLRTGSATGPGGGPTTTRFFREDADAQYIQTLLDRIHGRGNSWGWYESKDRSGAGSGNVLESLPNFFSHRMNAGKHDLATVTGRRSGRDRRKEVDQGARVGEGAIYLPDGVRVLLQLRACTTDAKTCRHDWREWDESDWPAVMLALNRRLYAPRTGSAPSVVPLASSDSKLMGCLTCQIHHHYSRSQLLIGVHGAGLTNMLFMPPGSMVFEIVGKFDGRMLPLCGYHGSLASVVGVHHYLYYYDWKLDTTAMPNITDIAEKIVEFYAAVTAARLTDSGAGGGIQVGAVVMTNVNAA